MVCHLLINGVFAYPKYTWSRDLSHILSHVGICDTLDACPHCWSHSLWSCEFMAHASYFSGSCVSQVTWVTCVIFVFRLRIGDSLSSCNVVDAVHDNIGVIKGLSKVYLISLIVFYNTIKNFSIYIFLIFISLVFYFWSLDIANA